jgi:error-prone DNA polymerase
MVIARQRPETAKGITFMLLEDERGTVNLVVPARVYKGRREVVRSAPLVCARGRLERREGTINVLVADLEALDWQEWAPSEGMASAADLAERRRAPERIVELRAVAPNGHSFGRRGR